MRDVRVKGREVDLAKVISGDNAAWDSFVETFSGLIHHVVARTLLSRSVDFAPDVVDVSQDVFVRLIKDDYRLLRTYDGERAALPAWLTVVSTSVALNRLRRPEYRQDTVELDDALPAREDPAGQGRLDLPRRILSERQTQILRLLFDEGLEPAEVSRALNITAQTVRSLKHQALERLREHYCAGRSE